MGSKIDSVLLLLIKLIILKSKIFLEPDNDRSNSLKFKSITFFKNVS